MSRAGRELTCKLTLAYSVSVGDVFKALADPTRRKLLDELAEREEQTLFELCARMANRHRLAMTRQAISQHLDVLEDAGLVESRREGRYRFHTLKTAPLETLTDRWLTPHRTEDR
jgi:DNA-binding transcriptional ArsR family regulator